MERNEVKVIKLADRREEAPAADPAPAAATAEIVGNIDAIADGVVYGWAWDRAHPEATLAVRLYADDRELGTALADVPRPDLRRNGIGSGAHAFTFVLPEDALGADLRIAAFAEDPDSGEPVALGRRRVGTVEDQDLAAELKRMQDTVDRLLDAQRAIYRNVRAIARPNLAAETQSAVNAAMGMPVTELKGITTALHAEFERAFAQGRRVEEQLKAVRAALDAEAGGRSGRGRNWPLIAIGAACALTLAIEVARLAGVA